MGWRVLWLTVAIAIGACATPAVAPAASPTTALARLSADEVTRAMAEDRLFSDYGQRTLVIDGTVAAVSATDLGARVALASSTSAAVVCDTFGAPGIKVGDPIQVRARTSDAERDPAGVLLRNCEIAAR
jgi:hypothetical protein